MKYGFFFFISVLAFVACQENEISTFDNESSLFFFRDIYNNNSKGTPQLDSTSYSFFLAGSIQIDTVWLDVLLTGSPSAQDRPFRIVQSNVGEPGAAVAGTHYVAFDDPEMVKRMVMPANKVSVAFEHHRWIPRSIGWIWKFFLMNISSRELRIVSCMSLKLLVKPRNQLTGIHRIVIWPPSGSGDKKR